MSTTDPDSGYMVREGKPKGFFYLDHRMVFFKSRTKENPASEKAGFVSYLRAGEHRPFCSEGMDELGYYQLGI